jgi:4-amino-4-deoxy-L-arabinose transferase-like glycosyltransferase
MKKSNLIVIPSSKSFLFVFFAALIIRMVNFFLLIPDDFNFKLEDQGAYVNLGLSMLETGRFVYDDSDGYVIETARTPLYPAFLAAIWNIVDYNPWVVVFIQSVVDSVTCIVIGLISLAITPRTFLLGGVLASVNMNLVASSGMILTDSLFLFLFTLFLWFTIAYLKSKNVKYLIILSLMLSLSILTRPVAYYLIPILGFVFPWFLFSKKESLSVVILHVLIFILTVSILLAPIIHRNYKQFDTISITSQSGLHLSKYLVPLALHFSEGISYPAAVNEVKVKIETTKQDNWVDDVNNPFEVSRYESKIAINRLFELGVFKASYSWVVGSTLNLISSGVMVMPWVRALPHLSFYNAPGKDVMQKITNFMSDTDSRKYLLTIVVANTISLLFFIVKLFGVYFLVKHSSQYGGGWIVFFILGLIIYFLLITGPIIGVKYMLPVEPFLTVLAVVGFSKWKRFTKWTH